MAAPASAPRDWQALYEQAQARADAAEARCEELLVAERTARSRAGSLKWALDKSRTKLEATVEEVKEVRRAAKDALFFQSEVARLEKLLSEAGVDSRKRSTIVALRMEVFQLSKALQASEGRKDTVVPPPGGDSRVLGAAPASAAGKDTTKALRGEVASLNRENARLHKALERSQEQKDELAALRRKVAALLGRLKRAAQASPPPRASAQLRKALERARKQKGTVKALRGEVASLNRETRRLNREACRLRREQEGLQGPQGDRALDDRRGRDSPRRAGGIPRPNARHRWAEDARPQSGDRPAAIRSQGRLEAEFDGRPLVSALFGRLRDRDKTIESLRKANERLGEKIKSLRAHRASLQARIVQLRSTRAVLSKAVFGGRSERQETPRSDRGRGQQRGASGHRPYPAACARGEGGTAGAAGGSARVFLLRQALCRERRAFLVRHRDRGQGPYPQDRAPALPPGLRLRVLGPGSDGAPAGAVVPQDALRDQRLGAHPLRALHLLPALAPGRGVDDGSGAGDRAGDDSRQRASLPASVRAARRGDPRPPERDGGAPRRRDRLAHPGAERDRPLAARVAVDLGRQGCRLLPHRPLAQRRGREEAVRFGQGYRVPGLRPLRRLREDGARARRQGDPVLVLDPPEARLHRVRRRPGEAEALVRGMGRAVRRRSAG